MFDDQHEPAVASPTNGTATRDRRKRPPVSRFVGAGSANGNTAEDILYVLAGHLGPKNGTRPAPLRMQALVERAGKADEALYGPLRQIDARLTQFVRKNSSLFGALPCVTQFCVAKDGTIQSMRVETTGSNGIKRIQTVRFTEDTLGYIVIPNDESMQHPYTVLVNDGLPF